MGSHVPSLEFLAVLLGDQPAIPPSTWFYQRLLAHDQREASNLLFNALKSDSLLTVYDAILIPALTLVEKDRQQGDLDDTTLAFIRNTTGELVEELGFRALEEQSASSTVTHEPTDTASAAGTANSASSPNSAASAHARSFPGTLDPSTRHEGERTVAVVPVRDGADALVATMLTQVLTLAGINAISLPVRAIHETVEAVGKQKAAMVFLSGMPPVAMARANRLYRSLRAEQPSTRFVVGIWNYADDPTRVAQMLTRSEDLHISTSLADAVAQAASLTEARPAVPHPLDASPQLVAAPKDTAA
jgi:hypothetical protein